VEEKINKNMFFSPIWVAGAMFSIGYIFTLRAVEFSQIPIWGRFLIAFAIYIVWPLLLGIEVAG
jgi:hypothetical protein